MSRLRIGVLGASKIAPVAVIAPAKAHPAVEVRAIAARDPARARSFAAVHDIPYAHRSYQSLISDPDIDLVYNALPPKHHQAWTIAALEAGKHVLLEKPSGMNATEAALMVDTAAKAGRRLIEALHYRYHPLFARVIEIARNQIGVPKFAEAVFKVPIPYSPDEIRYDQRLGGGALMDLGCYPIHWLRSISEMEPQIVSAIQVRHLEGADLSTTAQLRFPSGLEGTVSCSMAPGSGRPMASLSVRGSSGELTVLNPLAPQLGHLLTWTDGDGRAHQETFPPRATYDYQLDAVVTALNDGSPVPTEGDDIVATMHAIDSVRAATQRNKQ